MDRFKLLRENYPNFSLDINKAIKVTKVSQPYLYELFLLHTQERNLKKLGKQIDRILWSRKRDDEKIALLSEAIVEFNCHLQRLKNLNHEDANLEPLHQLYNGFVMLIPDRVEVQLKIEFQRF